MLDAVAGTAIPIETETTRACDQCGEPFQPRVGSGGKPQRFCSEKCKSIFHTERLRSQRGPTYSGSNVGVDRDKPDEPTPHEFRNLLIDGGKHFEAKFGAGSIESTEEMVDRVLAEGKVRAPRPEPVADADDFSWRDSNAVVLREQYATAIYFNKDGELVIRQQRWPDEDQLIFIGPECQQTFIDKLTDALGIPSAP